MNIERAREIVALCWLDSRTRRIPKDQALTEIFAERLAKLVNAAEALYRAGEWVLAADLGIGAEAQAELWDDLRDALGLPEAEVDTGEIVSGQTVSMTSFSRTPEAPIEDDPPPRE